MKDTGDGKVFPGVRAADNAAGHPVRSTVNGSNPRSESIYRLLTIAKGLAISQGSGKKKAGRSETKLSEAETYK